MIWVRWTTHAADDLAHIVERIREHKPEAAQRVTRTICTSVASLRTLPHRGRMGLAPDTRELVFPPWPYIVVYGLSPTFVQPGAMAEPNCGFLATVNENYKERDALFASA